MCIYQKIRHKCLTLMCGYKIRDVSFPCEVEDKFMGQKLVKLPIQTLFPFTSKCITSMYIIGGYSQGGQPAFKESECPCLPLNETLIIYILGGHYCQLNVFSQLDCAYTLPSRMCMCCCSANPYIKMKPIIRHLEIKLHSSYYGNDTHIKSSIITLSMNAESKPLFLYGG